MAINRSQLRKHLEPGLNAMFGLSYKQYPDEGQGVYEMENSVRAFEEEQMNSGFGNAVKKAEGGPVSFDTAQETFTARYNHMTYALAFRITEEAIEDNLYERLGRQYSQALGRSMAHTKNIEAASVLNYGFTAGEHAIGDGKALFASDHPTLAGDQSNTLAVAADLSEAALEDMMIKIRDTRDEKGLRIAAAGKRLVIPPDLMFVAQRILASKLRSGTSDNDINALRSMGLLSEAPAVMQFLTDPDAWFVKTDVPNGLKRFNRVTLSTKMDEDFHTGDLLYKCRERYSHGVSDWRGIWGVAGA